MKVILTTDVEKVGSIGEIVDVKAGFARNFLFPRKLADEVTPHTIAVMESRKKKALRKMEAEKLSAQEQKAKIDGIVIRLTKKAGENDVLFGSVTVAELEEELKALNIEVERKKIHLEEPIKRLGKFTCTIKLHRDVEASIQIEVHKEGEETPAENT
jgi:large subunit ribosomal protein L9